MRPKTNSLNLALAKLDDVDILVEMAEKFHKESQNSQTFDLGITRDNIIGAIKDRESWLVLILQSEGKPVGMLIAVTVPSLFGSDKLAVELSWYVEPEYRATKKSLEMLKMYEYWAENLMHVDLISLSSLGTLSEDRLDKLYTRLGYKKEENTYVKRRSID